MGTTHYLTTDPTDRVIKSDTITILPKSQAERDCEAFAELFNNRHRPRKAKRLRRTPEFVISQAALSRDADKK